MTPGQYIRACREETGLTCEDVALCLESDPPISCRARADLLASIEADLVPMSLATAVALGTVQIGVDLHRLAELVDEHAMRLAGESGAHFQIAGAPRLRRAITSPLWLNLGGEAEA